MDDICSFDWVFFGIQHAEAQLLDPQQALLLEAAFHALPCRLGRDVGVWIGIGANENLELAAQALDIQSQSVGRGSSGIFAVGNNRSATASRLSKHFDWKGPAVSLDTACSSSLFALDSAVRMLRTSDLHAGLAAAVNVILSQCLMRRYASMGMLSPSGSCRSFDDLADGIVRSEGCGALFLREQTSAMESEARILGIATNNNGSAAAAAGPTGIMWPSGKSQEELLALAMRDAFCDKFEIRLIEAHGTGTRLGDPVEAAALSSTFSPGMRNGDGMLVGACKSVLGHHEAAAGMMGMLKAINALAHRSWTSSQHLEVLNSHIDGTHLQFVCSTLSLSPVESHGVAGVSSFGFSGSNAHVLLRKPPKPERLHNDLRQPKLWKGLQDLVPFLAAGIVDGFAPQKAGVLKPPYILSLVTRPEAFPSVCLQLSQMCQKVWA